MDRILLFPAGILQREAFIQAKELGLHIVTVDRSPDAPCFKLADEHFCLDPGNEDELLNFVAEYHLQKPLSGALVVGCDIPVSCAKVARFLGTPAISIEAAQLTVNKLAMKKVLREQDLPVPDFFEVRCASDLERYVNEYDCKMALKPNDNCAARGVLQICPGSDYEKAFAYARQNVKESGVVLEKFESGPQVSIEGLVYDEKVCVTGFADRNYEFIERFFPYIIENGATIPSALTTSQQEEIIEVFTKGVKALGINNSVAKGDIVFTGEGAKVIEIAGRISGGKFASRLVPEATGVNLLKAALKLAIGQNPDLESLQPTRNRAVAVRYFFPDTGRVAKVNGVKEARSLPGVTELITTYESGDRIPEIKCHADRGGWVVSSGTTRNEAVSTAEKAISTVEFEINSQC